MFRHHTFSRTEKLITQLCITPPQGGRSGKFPRTPAQTIPNYYYTPRDMYMRSSATDFSVLIGVQGGRGFFTQTLISPLVIHNQTLIIPW